jgi:RecB family exonuclease
VRHSAAAALDSMDDADVSDEQRAAAEARLREAATRLGAIAMLEAGRDVPGRGDDPSLDAYLADLERALAFGARPRKTPGMSPPLRLSFTTINDYERCPRCFYLKHIQKIREPGDQAMRFGSSIHGALETFYRQWRDAELDDRPQPGLDHLLELGRSHIVDDTPANQSVSEEDLKRAESMLRLAYEHLHTDDAHILEIEHVVKFPYTVDGVEHTLTAKIDRIDQIDGGHKIIDYKTGKASKDKLEPKNKDLQFGIYAMALNHVFPTGEAEGAEASRLDPPPGSAEYWLLGTGQRGLIALTSLDMVKIRSTIDEAVRGILAGDFEPKRNCSGLCAQISGLGG